MSFDFDQSNSEIDEDDGSSDNAPITLDLQKEITNYIKLKVNEQNVLDFWRNNKKQFPILFCIATMLLSSPATSTPSERVFSDAKNNLYDKRNKMTSECFEMLMFLYENLEFFNLI